MLKQEAPGWRLIHAAAVGITILAALASPAGAQATLPGIPAERYRLANGLEVILHQDRSIPIVHVNVTYHVGSGHERPGQSGYAHLFEHLMFQGTRHTGNDEHFAILRSIGARDVNGTTNAERTNYFQSVPAAELETALWLESDRMGYLRLDQETLDNQREVVRNERRDRYENVAFKQEIFAAALVLYPEGHPYRHLTIGRHEDLQRATLEDARAFFARWYVPANATLVLAGDFELPTARALVDKWFGSFPASTRPKVTVPSPPVLRGKHREMFTDPLATTARVRYVWASPPFLAPGDAELDLIADLLDSNSGRLRKLLMIDRSLARAVSAVQQSRTFSSEFHIVVDLLPGARIADVDNALTTAIRNLTFGTVEPRELKQALAAREVSTRRGLETLSARAGQLQLYALHDRDFATVEWDLERYRKVTPADLKATATRVLTDKRVEIVTVPMPRPSAEVARLDPLPLPRSGTRPPPEAAQPLEAVQHPRLSLPVPARLPEGN